MSQSMSCPLPNYKLVVVGDPEVGKSALCFQYFERNFITEYDPTIEDSYMHHINIDGKWCLVEVLDTAGKEEFSTWRKRNINEGDGFLLVYSVIDEKSLENIRNYYLEILEIKGSNNFPMLLVGNKFDLVDLRRVTVEQGGKVAEELKVSLNFRNPTWVTTWLEISWRVLNQCKPRQRPK